MLFIVSQGLKWVLFINKNYNYNYHYCHNTYKYIHIYIHYVVTCLKYCFNTTINRTELRRWYDLSHNNGIYILQCYSYLPKNIMQSLNKLQRHFLTIFVNKLTAFERENRYSNKINLRTSVSTFNYLKRIIVASILGCVRVPSNPNLTYPSLTYPNLT